MSRCTVDFPQCLAVAVTSDRSRCTCPRPNRADHEKRIRALEKQVQEFVKAFKALEATHDAP